MKKSRAPSANRGRRRPRAGAKRSWEMNTEELRESTAEFDREFVGETFREPTAAQKQQLARAKRRRGRPPVGQGVQVISVSIEKGLLAAVDKIARQKKAKRAQIISAGLRAIVNGRLPIDTEAGIQG